MPYSAAYQNRGQGKFYFGGKYNPRNNSKAASAVVIQRAFRKKYAMNPRFQKVSKGPERKYQDISTGAINTNSTGTVYGLNQMIQGTANGQRIGQRILMTSIHLYGQISESTANLAASTGYQTTGCNPCRCVLVYDKQPNGAAPGWSTVYSSTGTIGPMGKRLDSTRKRFDILYDSGLQMIMSGGPNGVVFEKFVNCKLETQYTTTNNGDITDIISGALFLMIIDSNSNANLPATGVFYVRCNYTDE